MFFFCVRHDIRHFPLRHPPYFYGGFLTLRHEPPSAINNIALHFVGMSHNLFIIVYLKLEFHFNNLHNTEKSLQDIGVKLEFLIFN